jgi:hypothetical protein
MTNFINNAWIYNFLINMTNEKRKTIVITQTTFDKLSKYGKFGQSTNDVILDILNKLHEQTKQTKQKK